MRSHHTREIAAAELEISSWVTGAKLYMRSGIGAALSIRTCAEVVPKKLSVMRSSYHRSATMVPSSVSAVPLPYLLKRRSPNTLTCAAEEPSARLIWRIVASLLAATLKRVTTSSSRLDETSEVVTLRQWIDGEPDAQGAAANEYVPAALVRHVRELIGGDVEIAEVLLAHPRPAEVSSLRAFFGDAQLVFGTGYNGISVRREIMDRPQLASNPVLMRALDEHAHWMMSAPSPVGAIAQTCPASNKESAERDDGFVEAVRHAILSNLTHSEALLPRVAEVVSMTPRTLQRRLRSLGWSFRQLVDVLRREAAQKLASGQRSSSEVAYLLGYTELSSFSRASKRWQG